MKRLQEISRNLAFMGNKVSEADIWKAVKQCPCQRARLEKLGLFLVTAGFKQRLNDQN